MSQNNIKTSITNLVHLHETDTVEQARASAVDLAANAFGQVCPVILFQQGGRTCASTAIPVSLAVRILTSDAVDKKASLESVKKAYNRPIDKEHVRSVSKYIVGSIEDSTKYILPSLTVNALKDQHIYTPSILNSNFVQLGYLVLSLDDPSLSVTDGQHRLEGLKAALSELEGENLDKLKNDSISIMFSFESDIDQVHQDFADCSKTKALPKSMIAVYDRRVPANGLILDIIEQCSLFNDGRTDSTSVSLSKKSNCFVLTNSVRAILKSLLTGNHSMADKAFDTFANKALGNKADYDKNLIDTVSTIKYMTEYSPILKEISNLPRGPQRQKLVEFRDKYLIANPFGLVLAAKVINRYLMLGNNEKETFIKRLMTEINWDKSADIWAGNVITEKAGKHAISSTNKPVSNAVIAIGKALDIDLEPQNQLL